MISADHLAEDPTVFAIQGNVQCGDFFLDLGQNLLLREANGSEASVCPPHCKRMLAASGTLGYSREQCRRKGRRVPRIGSERLLVSNFTHSAAQGRKEQVHIPVIEVVETRLVNVRHVKTFAAEGDQALADQNVQSVSNWGHTAIELNRKLGRIHSIARLDSALRQTLAQCVINSS